MSATHFRTPQIISAAIAANRANFGNFIPKIIIGNNRIVDLNSLSDKPKSTIKPHGENNAICVIINSRSFS